MAPIPMPHPTLVPPLTSTHIRTFPQVATSEEADEPGDAMDTSPIAADEPPTPMRKRLMERLGSESLPPANGAFAGTDDASAPRQPLASLDSQPSATPPAAQAAAAEPTPKALLPAPVRLPRCSLLAVSAAQAVHGK